MPARLPDTRRVRPGDVVAGRFEIGEVAAAGGMGIVFRAIDRQTDSRVALKVLRSRRAEDRGRFDREAAILSELGHPGIVRYLAHGATAADELYLAIEWLEGEDLAARLARGGRLSIEETLVFARAVAAGLSAAHGHGVVHRDVKPDNLFLPGGAFAAVKILDFGVARIRNEQPTATLAPIGTPGYMAPEQARADPHVDARTDVYSLGCVLFECLTGRPAFRGDHIVALLAKVLLEDPPRVSELRSDVPRWLDELVGRMLSKDPAGRPADGAEVAQEIAAGARDTVAARPEQRPALTRSEQRWFSVVVAGGPLSRSEPASDAAPTIADPAPWLARVRGPIERLGVQLELLAHGSVIATIPGAVTVTDQAARAARVALALRAEIAEAPIAIASGRGRLAARWPVGEVIDRAVSLLERAHTRTILVDDATADLLDARFETRAGESGTELAGEREAEDARRLLGKPTPFVGRESELGVLETIVAGCVSEPSAATIVVIGAPGMGKTRLRREFIARVRRQHSVQVWIGRADPVGAGSPFALLGSALRNAMGIRAAEPLEARRRKLVARVSRHVPDGEQQRVTEFLGELLEIPFGDEDSVQLRVARRDATLMGDQMMRAWQDLLEAEATAEPVLLVLEDLQWGDRPSVSFVDAALRSAAELPFVVLALARPEVHEVFPDLWEARGPSTVQLTKLSRRASETLLSAVLGPKVDPAVASRVIERAAGNPFYLEELLRAVAEGRHDELPDTVLAMLHARLERLDPEARRVLRAASVLGRVFWRGAVAAMLGRAPIGDWLPMLAHGELIEQRSARKFPGEDEYVFRHALLRDAVYATFTEEDRALGHRIAAAWLEAAGETDAVVLAEHHVRGGESALAVPWFLRGAEQALEGHDFVGAIDRAERGVSAGAADEVLGALLLVQAEAHRWRGEFSQAYPRAEEATRRLRMGCAAHFHALEEVMTAASRLGQFTLAAGWAASAAEVEPEPGAEGAHLVCLCSAARVLFHAGDYPAAERVLGRVEALAKGHAAEVDPGALAEAFRARGARARHHGDLAEDVRGYAEATTAFERAGDARNACNARTSLGFAYVEIGDLERAQRELESALGAAEKMGLHTVATRARQNLGLVLALSNRHDEALELLQRVVDESQAQQNIRFEGWTRVYLANTRFAAGAFIEAEAEAQRAAVLLAQTPPARAGALAASARARLRLGHAESAREAADEAMEILRSLGGIEEFESLVWVAAVEANVGSDARSGVKTAVAARQRLLERAGRIEDPAIRASFLTQVPENVRLLELADACLGDAPLVRDAYDPEAFRARGHRLIDQLADHLSASLAGETSVLDWTEPASMATAWPAAFDAPAGTLRDLTARLVAGSVRQHHPRYLGHQVSAPLPVAALAALATAVLNNGMAAYESGPAISGIERNLVRWLCARVGWPDGDGVLTSGGTLGNLTALLAARAARRDDGDDRPLAVLVTDQAHYSVARASQIMGWGAEGIVTVPVDDRFRMRPEEFGPALRRAEDVGRRVIGVVANAGSTATGSFDPIDPIADFCAGDGLWLHVDGAHGASAALSTRYRELLAGVERADSLVWDAHKLLAMPALVTAVLFRERARSYGVFAQRAAYLFADRQGDEPWHDIGMRTIECTKRMMAFELYASLHVHGVGLFDEHVTGRFDLARAFARRLRAQTDFEVLVEPECNIVCFRWTGAGPGHDLDAMQDGVRQQILEGGRFFLVRTRLRDAVWLRTTLMSPLTVVDDLDALLAEIRAAGGRVLDAGLRVPSDAPGS